MSTWIAVDDELPYIHKTATFRRMLKAGSTREAMSYLIMLWLYTLKVAWRNGDLSPYGESMIEEACEWKGEPGALVKAMRECGHVGPDGIRGSGFLDGYIVHDWVERSGKLINDRIYREERRAGGGTDLAPKDPEAQLIHQIWNNYAKMRSLPASARAPKLPDGMNSVKFQLLLDAAAKQPFLHGAGPQHWRMDLGWLLRPANTEKVLASGYFVKESGAAAEPVGADEGDPGGYRQRTKDLLARRKAQGIQ